MFVALRDRQIRVGASKYQSGFKGGGKKLLHLWRRTGPGEIRGVSNTPTQTDATSGTI